jgi:hypothetical protein
VSISRVLSLLALAAVVPVYATTIIANSAGALPGTAEDLTGLSPTEIVGTLPDTTDPLLGVNMFKIVIANAEEFSAIAIGSPFGVADTVLALFDSAGLGVYLNDDISGADTLSCLPSAIANPCPSAPPPGVGPIAAGIYYLAISRSSNYPISASGEIFSPVFSTDVVGPDLTMGGGGPITGWDGGAFTTPDTDLVDYDILLTGTTPEPATWIMTGAACLLLGILRSIKTPQSRT